MSTPQPHHRDGVDEDEHDGACNLDPKVPRQITDLSDAPQTHNANKGKREYVDAKHEESLSQPSATYQPSFTMGNMVARMVIENSCWWLIKRDWQPVLVFLCPGCEVKVELQHLVRPGGEVDPSVECPNCTFHEYLFLSGWGDVEMDFAPKA
jgi:hypothetical protein